MALPPLPFWFVSDNAGSMLPRCWGPFEEAALACLSGMYTIGGRPTLFDVWGNVWPQVDVEASVVSVREPSRVFADLNLFVGDIDDLRDVPRLQRLNIAAVVYVCGDILTNKDYSFLPQKLGHAQIEHMLLSVEDACDFAIIPMVECAQDFIANVLAQQNGGVLVCGHRDCNRSGAVCAIYLVRELGMNLTFAVEWLRAVRPTALRNPLCLQQLIVYCRIRGYSLL